jgi:hypothetical protein
LPPPPTTTTTYPAESTLAESPEAQAHPGKPLIKKPLLWIILAALIAISVFVVIVTASSKKPVPTTQTLTGTMQITDSTNSPFDGNNPPSNAQLPCDGSLDTGGYNDLAAGATVTVKNGSGNVIATGSLQEGTAGGDGSTCSMPFTVADVPQEPFYQVEVANRGNVTFSLNQMRNSEWVVSLTIGS